MTDKVHTKQAKEIPNATEYRIEEMRQNPEESMENEKYIRNVVQNQSPSQYLPVGFCRFLQFVQTQGWFAPLRGCLRESTIVYPEARKYQQNLI